MPKWVMVGMLAAAGLWGQDTARMEQVVESYVNDGKFMGTVLVARGTQALLDKGYGSADLEWGVANAPGTKFRLGSVTKQFTAASILMLEERGKLSVEDPVKKYIAGAPAAWDKITLRNLLTHTSGIPNFTSFPEYSKMEPFPAKPAQILALFENKPLEFAPGAKMSYCNSGYVVLGMVVEKASGESYAKFVQDNIFTPLGMKDSGYDSNREVIPHRASGYVRDKKGFENAGYVDMTIPFSAGALYSTTEDLLKWEQGLFGGKLLKPESLKKMTTPYLNHYAFGLFVNEVKGRTVVSHGGGIEGFNTHLAYYPEDKLTVVVLSNVNGPAPGEIAGKLAALAHGEKVTLASERTEVAVPAAELGQYVGTYDMGQGLNMYMRQEGDHLTTQLSGQGQLRVYGEANGRFFLKEVDAELEFQKDGGGKVTAVVLHQGGMEMKGEKKSGTVAERQVVEIPAATLENYAGKYELRPGMEMTVSVESGKLYGQVTGQPRFEMFGEGDDRFFFKVVDATVQFERDGGGKVTGLKLHQGPVEMEAPRTGI